MMGSAKKKRPVLAVTPASSIRLPDLVRSETHSLMGFIGEHVKKT